MLCLIWCRVVQSRDVHFDIWSRIVRSCDARFRDFSAPLPYSESIKDGLIWLQSAKQEVIQQRLWRTLDVAWIFDVTFSERVRDRWNRLDQLFIDSVTINAFKSGLERTIDVHIGFFADWWSAKPCLICSPGTSAAATGICGVRT